MTQPFQSSKFLIAQGPVNWYEPLAEAVAKRNQQEEQSLQEWTAHRNEKVQVKAAESPIKVLEAIATFSKTAGNLAATIRQSNQAKDAEADTYSKNFVHGLYSGYDSEALAKVLKWTGDRNKMFTEDNKAFVDLIKPLSKDGKLLPEHKAYINDVKKLSGRRMIQVQEEVILKESQKLSDLQAYRFSDTWNKRYPTAKDVELYDAKSGTDKEREHKAWWADRIRALGANDDMVLKYMGSELQRSSSTRRNIAAAKTVTAINSADAALAESFGITKGATPNPADYLTHFWDQIVIDSEGLTTLADGTTPLQQAAQINKERFLHLLENGLIPHLTVTDIKNFTREHKAGKGGRSNIIDAFFKGDPKVLDEIIRSSRIGDSKRLAAASALDNRYANKLLRMGGTGNMTKQDFDVEVLNLKGRGNLSAQTLAALDRVDPTEQSQVTAATEQLTLDALVSTGRTTNFDDAIAGFTQNSVREEGKTVKQELSKFRSDMRLDKTSSESGNNSDNWALNQVDVGLGLNLPPLGHLKAGTQSTAQRIISRIRDEEIGKQFKIAKDTKTLNDKTHASTIIVNVNRRLEELGFGKTVKEAGAGPLSRHETDQSFPGLETYHEAIVEAGKESRIGSNWPVVNQEAVAIKDHIVKSGKASALNEKGLIVKNPEFLGLLNNVDPNGRITSWPPDLLLKAEMIGVAPGVIAARQLEALLSSKDDQDYVKLHQLDKLTPILANYDQADAKWRQFLKDINDPSLPPDMNISRITGNQFQRIMQYEQLIDAADTQDTQRRMLATQGLPSAAEENRDALRARIRREVPGLANASEDELNDWIEKEKEKHQLIKQGVTFPYNPDDTVTVPSPDIG